MKHFLFLVAACLLSLTGYIVLFGFVVARPLVVDQIDQFMERKVAYAASTPHPKIFILAGSNARFSHSCATLEEQLRRPCINMGIAADVALDWTFDKVKQQLQPGDLVYLPLEYGLYSHTRLQIMTGMDAAFRFRHDKLSLASRGAEGILRAAFMFSLPTLVQSVGEMGLDGAGVKRRSSTETMNRQGDETGHDGESALPYRAVVSSANAEYPNPASLMANPEGVQTVLAAFLTWCRSQGVVAVGGLPTIFNDQIISPQAIEQLRAFYNRHGAQFLVLDNYSQYPRDSFYDTAYHLRQSVQRHHSQLLAGSLKPILQDRGQPAPQ